MSDPPGASVALAPLYLLETRLLETCSGRAHGVEGSGRCVDELEELVRGLGALLLHHGHGAEERLPERRTGYKASSWIDSVCDACP